MLWFAPDPARARASRRSSEDRLMPRRWPWSSVIPGAGGGGRCGCATTRHHRRRQPGRRTGSSPRARTAGARPPTKPGNCSPKSPPGPAPSRLISIDHPIALLLRSSRQPATLWRPAATHRPITRGLAELGWTPASPAPPTPLAARWLARHRSAARSPRQERWHSSAPCHWPRSPTAPMSPCRA